MQSNNTRIVIVGATSSMAEHCARLWVKSEAVDLTLIGRDIEKTERIAVDLRVRSPQSNIRAVQAESFIDPIAIQRLVDDIVKERPVHKVLIAHGSLPDQELCQDDMTACAEALEVNGLSPVIFAEAFVKHMVAAGNGTIAIIGSVAGDRGRKSNYVYGAAKGLVTRYTQGLQHRLARSSVKVVLIKPGPTDTPMTANIKGKGARLARVEDVADAIVNGVAAGKPVVYAPAKWWLIMMIIRHLPRFIFNKMDI